jgi:hypothetical protein
LQPSGQKQNSRRAERLLFVSIIRSVWLGSLSYRCKLVIRIKPAGIRALVIKISVHLPVSEIEPTLRSTIETNPVRVALVRKWPTHVCMPAAKYSSHPAANFFTYGRRIHLMHSWSRDG